MAFLQESFQGTKSIVMQTSTVFGPNFEERERERGGGGGGAKVSAFE